MRDLVNKKLVKKKFDRKGRGSALWEETTFLAKNGQTILSQREIRSQFDKFNKGYDLEFLLEGEKKFLINFLKSIGCPFDVKGNYSQSGYKSLVATIEETHQSVPGATDAARALNELDLCDKKIECDNHKEALVHILRAEGLIRRVLFSIVEPSIKAGASRTSEAVETRIRVKENIMELAEPIYLEFRSKNLSKEKCYSLTSQALLKIHGEDRAASTIKGWFKGRLDLR